MYLPVRLLRRIVHLSNIRTVDVMLNLCSTALRFDQVRLALNGLVSGFIFVEKRKKKNAKKTIVYLSLVQRKAIKSGNILFFNPSIHLLGT